MAVYLEDRLLDAIELAESDGYELLADGLRDAAERVEQHELKWSVLWAAVKAIIGEKVFVSRKRSQQWGYRRGSHWTNDCDYGEAESILADAR